MRVKRVLCYIIGHKWGEWIALDREKSVRQCLQCLVLENDFNSFFDDDD